MTPKTKALHRKNPFAGGPNGYHREGQGILEGREANENTAMKASRVVKRKVSFHEKKPGQRGGYY